MVLKQRFYCISSIYNPFSYNATEVTYWVNFPLRVNWFTTWKVKRWKKSSIIHNLICYFPTASCTVILELWWQGIKLPQVKSFLRILVNYKHFVPGIECCRIDEMSRNSVITGICDDAGDEARATLWRHRVLQHDSPQRLSLVPRGDVRQRLPHRQGLVLDRRDAVPAVELA